jgi:hypothetical protein
LRAASLDLIEGLIARVLQHAQRITLLDDIAGDALAHETDSDHADFFHDLVSFLLCCVRGESFAKLVPIELPLGRVKKLRRVGPGLSEPFPWSAMELSLVIPHSFFNPG